MSQPTPIDIARRIIACEAAIIQHQYRRNNIIARYLEHLIDYDQVQTLMRESMTTLIADLTFRIGNDSGGSDDQDDTE